VSDDEVGVPFVSGLLEETLHHYALTEIKYKARPKQQKSLYFGRSGSPEKQSKQDQDELKIKGKWKELYVGLVVQLTDLAFGEELDTLKELIK
jgi:hypothetical protein